MTLLKIIYISLEILSLGMILDLQMQGKVSCLQLQFYTARDKMSFLEFTFTFLYESDILV